MSRRTVKTSHSSIFEYWKNKMITPSGDILEDDFNDKNGIPAVYDWGEPCCWACGEMAEKIYDSPKYEELLQRDTKALYDLPEAKRKLNRCHIVPHQAGGEDAPSNLFLLCEKCHLDSPDTLNPNNFFKWVYMKRKSGIYFYGHNIADMSIKYFEECNEKNKDPLTGNFEKMPAFPHGFHVSDASIYMALADTCEDLT